MARFEIELAPDEHAQLKQEAERASLPSEWVRRQMLRRPAPAFVTDDGAVFEIPDLPEDLGRACALASEPTLKKFWDVSEENAAWRDM